MEHLDKIDKMIQRHKSLTREIKNVTSWKNNISSYEESCVKIYEEEFYGSVLPIVEVEGVILHLRDLQNKAKSSQCTNKLQEYFSMTDNLLIDWKQLKNVDMEDCSMAIRSYSAPEPWEDYNSYYTSITISGEVIWSEEQQKEEHDKAEAKLKELNEKLFELETQMKGMSLM